MSASPALPLPAVDGALERPQGEYDVIVAGSGAAGLFAAVAAHGRDPSLRIAVVTRDGGNHVCRALRGEGTLLGVQIAHVLAREVLRRGVVVHEGVRLVDLWAEDGAIRMVRG